MARSYRCPLCGSTLTKGRYDRVTKLDAARAEELHEAHLRIQQAKQQAKDARKVGEEKGRQFEKRRSERLVQGLEMKLTIANDRIAQLK